jgi:hypothetical protein
LPPPRGSGGVDLGRQVEPCWHLRSERLIRTPDARRPDGGRSCGQNGLRSSPRPVENIPQQDSAQNAFDKLARTFAARVEALKRYRSGGEQKMTVQHVHVAEGGQAIVGNVNAPTEGVGARKKLGGSTPYTVGLCTRRRDAAPDRSAGCTGLGAALIGHKLGTEADRVVISLTR